LPVGADEPVVPDGLPLNVNLVGIKSGNSHAPMERDAGSGGALDEKLV
jgi:hypothetical protein